MSKSRIGNRVLTIPAGVEVTTNGTTVTVIGPKGELSTEINQNIKVEIVDGTLKVVCENPNFSAFHGTANANIKNMIIGVTDGYEKGLEAYGVGYRFQLKGKTIVVTAGYSHPVEVEVPEGLSVESPSNTELIIKGINKELVGEFAANIRKIRQPEPYKGKGIRYKGEHVRRKEGKKAA